MLDLFLQQQYCPPNAPERSVLSSGRAFSDIMRDADLSAFLYMIFTMLGFAFMAKFSNGVSTTMINHKEGPIKDGRMLRSWHSQ